MPCPIKLIRKVPITFFSHISLIVVILSLILFHQFLITVKSALQKLKESVISLAVSALSSNKITKITISAPTVNGPKEPARLGQQAKQSVQPPEIPNAPNIRSQPPKILISVSMGPRGDVLDS